MGIGPRTWATPVLLVDAAAALVGLLALVQVPLHDNELEIALWLWVVAVPAALGAAYLTEWRIDAQEGLEREASPWGAPMTVQTKTRALQIVLGVVANVAVVAGYASFVKHFFPSVGVMLLLLTAVTASSAVAVCWPGGQTASDPNLSGRGAA
jgi:hypothetical protein